jgi:hypothetical protein
MDLTHSRPLSPLRATIRYSNEEFHMASDGEGCSGLPSPRRCNVGLRSPRHNHIRAGERSDHSGYDVSSIAVEDTAAGHRPPFRVTVHSSGGK